jgi:hypothetical protein
MSSKKSTHFYIINFWNNEKDKSYIITKKYNIAQFYIKTIITPEFKFYDIKKSVLPKSHPEYNNKKKIIECDRFISSRLSL